MIKKFLCILFSLFTVLNTFAADKFQVGDLYYTVISESEVQVVAQDITNNYPGLTNCTIPESITYQNITYKVTEIAFNAFNNAANLTSVTIPASVEYVGENESAYIPNESNAFYNTLKLNRIEVEEGSSNYISIDGVLFTKDKKMLISYPTAKEGTKYTIPEGVEKIGTYAFNGCSFSEIVFPGTLQILCFAAFHDCSKVTTVVCYATTPPVGTYDYTFSNTAQELLYVPEGAIQVYRESALWRNFKAILGIPSSVVILDESNDNTLSQLQKLGGQTIDVQLNRQFDADGAWYTLCLPFSLTEQQVAESLGKGCALMKLDYAQQRSSEDLYVHFASATTLEAGTPYLFKPANALTPPIFKSVVIGYQTDKENTIATPDKFVSMTGIYAPTQVPADKWYLGPDNTLYQSQGKVTSKGFRAYFSLSTSLPSKIRARVVMNNELPTDIDDIQVDTDVLPQKVLENGQVYILRGGHKYNLQGQVVE